MGGVADIATLRGDEEVDGTSSALGGEPEDTVRRGAIDKGIWGFL